MQKINVFWFRRDLRLYDNAGLFYALSDQYPVLPVFIFDRNILDELQDEHDSRVTFIHDQVTRLNEELKQFGSGLKVLYDTPEHAYQQLLDQHDINAVFTNRDYEPYAKERDKRVEDVLTKKNISFFTFKDHVIFEQGEILNDQNEPYKVFTPYKRRWLSKYYAQKGHSYHSENQVKQYWQTDPLEVPPLSSIGFKRSNIAVPPCELNKNIVKSYAKDRDFPYKDGTSRLGVHLRFGTLSIRKAVDFANRYSEVWLSELIWREFYSMIMAHFPHVVHAAFKSQYDRIEWMNDSEHFQRWCDGTTGYPIVDAGMRELNATGYMHNRVRMITASFLTKHLLIDWRWGEAYFASKLLDFDLASNNGGWQWAAGTGTDAQPYFRVFNPYSQQEKFDPKMEYIKQWVPELGTASYPEPIVEHKYARERAIKTFKESIS
ncbi:deoxyribodipyrimidine photo-lyase [Marinoscillum sp. MHG1-6]|uniref:cryptochrome/photolyase family protein n=1 Tax=Marinoscillum sp. MHG1-6 TaxID=2959627 RepID=UPI00215761CA|nr:deoxyribodipyrimidine photo-lyase [Marinoscillum sp. MHG1-6]